MNAPVFRPGPVRLPGWFIVLLLAALAVSLPGAETEPAKIPEAYARELSPQLTPLEPLLKLTGIPSHDNDAGCTLLHERIVSVDDRGRRHIVRHVAYRTLTEAAVKVNSEEIISFRKKEQQVFLVLAETIQPDGRRQAVKPNAVFIQSPQRQAEYSLYDDQSEMKIIFPDVRPGSVTHVIVYIEDLVPKIPGEYSDSLTWASTWAVGRARFVVEMPAAMSARLKLESIGSGLPAAVVQKRANNRVVRTWTLDKVPGLRDEIDRAPASQTGPMISLTTLHSWNEVGNWFQGLVGDRQQPGAALTKEADGWIGTATDPAQVIALLHTKVANEVRYVGLEFGAADYQPHHCDEVWENKYGDCKDKANLLVALLRQRGVAAYIALVNTEHQGFVDQRVPDYHPFDHAIVAIAQKDGRWLFCDPTIRYSVPGMLGPGAADRDVLVLRERGADGCTRPHQPSAPKRISST